MQTRFIPVAIAVAALVAVSVSAAMPTQAADPSGQKAPTVKAPTATMKPKGPKAGGVKLPTGGTVSELSTSDCKNVDGTVVHVADDRCGSSHQYCKLSNGNAVCIDKAN
jgi:hypothetical protein